MELVFLKDSIPRLRRVLACRLSARWLSASSAAGCGSRRDRVVAPKQLSICPSVRTRSPRAGNPLGGGAGAQADRAALVCAALVFAHAPPDAGVLAGVNRPAEAVFGHRATPAYLLGFFDLEQGWTAVANREEQLRVHFTAGGFMAPVHDVNPFSPARYVRPAVVNSSL